jgi:hypothetical protein
MYGLAFFSENGHFRGHGERAEGGGFTQKSPGPAEAIDALRDGGKGCYFAK